jgi:xanthine dehydrogenase YagR molybdenum-binding subunit
MSTIEDAPRSQTTTAVPLSQPSFLPGGAPDPVSREKHGLIGAQVSRVDGLLKVTGSARFAAEFPLDGMVYAALAFSTIAKGRIADLATAEAEAAPGVVLVMTYRNAPRLRPAPLFGSNPRAAAGDDLHILQTDRIHWNGQPIAVVLAESQEQADHAASLIRTTYDEDRAVTGFEDAKPDMQPASFQGEPLSLTIGDPEGALAAASVKVDNLYRTPRHNHNAIELHAVTVAWDGDTLRVHDASQCVAHVAWSLGQIFGLGEDKVHVTSPYVGGGFGGKTMWQHHTLAAAAAKLAGRPVRMALSREGVYRLVGGRTLTEQRVALGAQRNGGFEAIIHTGVVAKTPDNQMAEPFIVATTSAYAAAAFSLDVKTVDLDMLSNTFMRAPGEAVGTFALESAVDELAAELGMDPIELRIRNEPKVDPTKGTPFSSRHIVEAYRAGAERFGWSARNPTPGARREGEWLIGLGCATATYPYYRMPGGAARLTITSEGRAIVEVAAHEMGMGTATTHIIIAAERLGLPMDKVTFTYGDSELPGLFIAGGSQQTAALGAAVISAQRALVEELLKLAGNDSPLAGLAPDQVGCRDGGLCDLAAPDRCESYASILTRAKRDAVTVEAEASKPEEMETWSMHSFGAMFCEARVNAVTGETRIARFLGSFDCGRIINAKTAASQFRGGIVMGLGLALTEETQFDERFGRIMNPSLSEYHVPVHMDVPAIEVMWTDIPDPHTPMGAHGVGEIGITGVGAAVANAIFNATGKRLRDLPLTLDKVLAADQAA